MYDKLSATNRVTGGYSDAQGGQPTDDAVLRVASFWGESDVLITISGHSGRRQVRRVIKDSTYSRDLEQILLDDGDFWSVSLENHSTDNTICTVQTARWLPGE